jgi:uncharacterized protein YndB with AHSA1/START domain
MFGLFRTRVVPSCPFEFTDEVVIERSAEQVYALLDWADQRNAMRARGHVVTQPDGEEDTFVMRLDGLPNHAFGMIVTEAVPHSCYAFTIAATPTLGRIAQSHEHYTLTALDEGRCKVRIVNTAFFVERMPLKHLPEEELKVSAGCHNALAKLKIQAEGDAAAVEAVSGKLIV